MANYHFVGAAGIGMSALAQLVRAQGDRVSGSDRYFDLGRLPGRRAKLEAQGIRICMQDGSGVRPDVTHLVASSAIESDNSDLNRARDLNLVTIHRSNLLASLFHGCHRGVAVTGSFGKTSITAMIGWCLASAGQNPTIINGGIMRNFETEKYIGNAVVGDGTICCIEADESDGTCVKYRPDIGIITGLARDHKELDELHRIYSTFAANTTGALVLSEQAAASLFGLPGPRRITFGLRSGDLRAVQIRFGRREVRFNVGGTRFRMRQIGAYSVFNALAAITVLRELGLEDAQIEAGLRSFEGTARHMELVGYPRGIRIFDDFAHNPSKIEAALDGVRAAGAHRVLAVFQPHGFGPARFMRRDLVERFVRMLGDEDRVFLLPIYYVGGTAEKDISSADIAAEAAANGAPVEAVPDRASLVTRLAGIAREQDTILVMGARDDSLRDLCREIVVGLESRSRPVS
ncbi:MAG: Mur ligase domain-containing protein [Pseudomonadota bacterium]